MGTTIRRGTPRRGRRLASLFTAVLALAVKHRLTSLALPALGTGVGHVPPALSAEAMLEAIVSHLRAGESSLKRVIIMLYQDEAHRAFIDTLKRIGGIQ